MPTILQGQQLPAGTSTSSSQSQSAQSSATQFAPFAEKYLTQLSGAALGQLPQPGQQLVADQSALTTAAYNAAPGALTAYQAPLAAGQAAATDVAGGITPGDISRFYDPYQQAVVNELERQSQLSTQRNVLPALRAAFAGTGGFGSQRYAGATGQALGDIQANLLGKQADVMSSGYRAAVDAALREAGLQTQAAQTLGSLGGAEQTAATARLKALTDLGAAQQAFEQSKIEAPLARLQNIGQVMRGYPMQTSSASGTAGSTSQSQSNQYMYGPSPLSQLGTLISTGGTIASGLSNLLGLANASAGDANLNQALQNWLKQPDYNYPSNPFPTNPYNTDSGDTNTNTFE